MSQNQVKLSKFLSLVLRHKPSEIGLELDQQGWADVDRLLALINKTGRSINRALLEQIVASNDKQRFTFNEARTKIRANQGHSIEIDLALIPQEPPEQLFHGTATRFLASIHAQGLIPGQRQHVHLSAEVETAIKVGQRHGKPAVLIIRAGDLHRSGVTFFCSQNQVWLTDRVPPEYIDFP
jgi:putative RNA 2'-phosphotransferase